MNKYTGNNGNEIIAVGAPNSQAREDSKLNPEGKAAHEHAMGENIPIGEEDAVYKAFLAGIAWERLRQAKLKLDTSVKILEEQMSQNPIYGLKD